MKICEISAEDVKRLKDILFIDVREQSERQVAYIPNSVHIPLDKIKEKVFDLRTHALTHLRTVVYCASGCRSAAAVRILSKAGYKNVYSLKGGIVAWQKAGFNVVTGGALKGRQLLRYSRQMTLPQIGVEGQKRLLNSKVLIVGAGGLGSPAAFYLAAAGVGTLGVIDSDKVELDNLHRQILHTTRSVGEKKVRSAERTLTHLNDDIKVKIYDDRLTEKNVLKIFGNFFPSPPPVRQRSSSGWREGRVKGVVLDGSDNFPTRYIVNEACVKLGIPLVHGSILRFQGQVGVFCHPRGACHPRESLAPPHGWGGDIVNALDSRWSLPPNVLIGGGNDIPCYACLYPEPPPPEVAPTCADAGVLGVIPGIIGTMQALEAVKLIVGLGEPLIGKLLIFDGLTGRMRMLEVKRDPKCKVCGIVNS